MEGAMRTLPGGVPLLICDVPDFEGGGTAGMPGDGVVGAGLGIGVPCGIGVTVGSIVGCGVCGAGCCCWYIWSLGTTCTFSGRAMPSSSQQARVPGPPAARARGRP